MPTPHHMLLLAWFFTCGVGTLERRATRVIICPVPPTPHGHAHQSRLPAVSMRPHPPPPKAVRQSRFRSAAKLSRSSSRARAALCRAGSAWSRKARSNSQSRAASGVRSEASRPPSVRSFTWREPRGGRHHGSTGRGDMVVVVINGGGDKRWWRQTVATMATTAVGLRTSAKRSSTRR